MTTILRSFIFRRQSHPRVIRGGFTLLISGKILLGIWSFEGSREVEIFDRGGGGRGRGSLERPSAQHFLHQRRVVECARRSFGSWGTESLKYYTTSTITDLYVECRRHPRIIHHSSYIHNTAILVIRKDSSPGVASTWMGVLLSVGSWGGDLGSLKDGSVLSVEGLVGVELPLSLLSWQAASAPEVLAGSSDAVISRHNFTWLAPMV